MEKEFSNEAHRPICFSPSLLLRNCVVKGQIPNKESPESNVAIREREHPRSKSTFSICFI